MKCSKLPFRVKAAGIHLLISMLVVLISACLVFFIWHPNPLQKAVGVTHVFTLVMAIDVTLGALLTLLVASSPTKKTLKFDLAVIVLLQVAAFLYGMHTIAVSRPVYIAFDTLRFEVVQADTVVRDENTPPEYAQNPWFSPQWVAVRPYEDVAEQERRMQLEFTEAIAPSMQATLYQPLSESWQAIDQRKQAISTLPPQQLAAIHKKYPNAKSYLPLKTPVHDVDMVVVLDDEKKEILGIVNLSD